MSENPAEITIQNLSKKIELPILQPSLGNPVININNLAKAGYLTYDPGFVSTASCESRITYIDGINGILLYRGYPIEQLAEKSDYMETCYLLLYGELPTPKQKQDFINSITHHTLLHEQVHHFFQGFKPDAHPMAMMVAIVGGLAAYYHNEFNPYDPEQRLLAAHRLIAKIPTIAAMCYKHAIGQPFIYPNNKLSYTNNFMQMMFGTPSETIQPNPILVRALDRIFILHADHEQNASTSTVRLAGSTGANPFACIAAGIAALWGPAHGGANEATLKMLNEIGDVKHIGKFIERAKDPNDPFRLMGFGHRVYKNFDPRSNVMRQACHDVLNELGAHNHKLLRIALKLEEIALEDPYFIERKLYPNVDFYSGITLSALGIPTSLFTVIFALARTVGWISHWNEMWSMPDHRLSRPRQLYTGPQQRIFVELEKR